MANKGYAGSWSDANKKKLLERNSHLDIVKIYNAYQKQRDEEQEKLKNDITINELIIEQKIDYYKEVAENCPKCSEKLTVEYKDCLYFYKCANPKCNYSKEIPQNPKSDDIFN